jgi:RNA recognition motif-containing protein
MNGVTIESGETLRVTRYETPERKPAKISSASGNLLSVHSNFNNLYVKNFPSTDFSDADLRELFAKYGEISSAVVMRDD